MAVVETYLGVRRGVSDSRSARVRCCDLTGALATYRWCSQRVARVSGWVGSVRDSLRAQLWPLPTMGVLVAVVAGIVLPRIDAHIDSGLPRWLDDLLFGGDPDAARTVLDAVSSSLITVTSLTFSLTVVTLQLASSQFSPRLLRTFTRDLFMQATLALFLATFVYSLTVLRAVRTGGDTGSGFVPHLSVTFAFVLAVASVLGLVLFLAHLARQIRVETMLRTVHTDASRTADNTLGRPGSNQATTSAAMPLPPAGVRTELVVAPGSGFMIRIDQHELLDAVVDADAVLVIDCFPGDFLVAGTPIGRWWNISGSAPADGGRDKLARAVKGCVHTGFERTETQDVTYGLRQLTDVTNKALSPGINDPTTAVHALGHTSALLCELAQRELGPVVLADDGRRARLALARPGLADLLEVAMTQPRHYGAADPLVVGRLFTLLGELAWQVPPSGRSAVADQLDRLRSTSDNQDFDSAERTEMARLALRVEHALAGRWDASTRRGG